MTECVVISMAMLQPALGAKAVVNRYFTSGNVQNAATPAGGLSGCLPLGRAQT
jgi:hypothetical protein